MMYSKVLNTGVRTGSLITAASLQHIVGYWMPNAVYNNFKVSLGTKHAKHPLQQIRVLLHFEPVTEFDARY